MIWQSAGFALETIRVLVIGMVVYSHVGVIVSLLEGAEDTREKRMLWMSRGKNHLK